jgi:uncharacterized membrane protein YhaH (DUF805 family)
MPSSDDPRRWHVSDVSAGTILTLVVPLSLLFVVLGWWTLLVRRARRTRE